MHSRHTKKYLRYLPLLALVFLVLPNITFAETGLIEGSVQWLLWIFVVNVFGMLVSFGAMLLNAGIDYFVIGFGDIFNSSGMGVAVNETWVTIRDFINLFFIFGLVYIGIRMILDSDNSNTRRWLVNLIMAALLVNFSLFATKFVVDFSNKLATEVADAGLGAEKDPTTGVYTSNVGGELMNRMGITSALGGQPKDSGWGYIFGTAILFMVSAFVFAAGGILLIIRFAVICLYLVLSPVMFASWVLPGLSDTMSRYWKDFIKRCFFAPIYFVFIYFAFQVIGGLQISLKGNGTGASGTNLANPNWAGTFNADPAAAAQSATLGTLPFFVLICIFMILSLVAANKLGAEGAGKAISIGKKLSNKVQSGAKRGAGAATFGLAAKGGQATAGALANAASNNRRFQNFAANNKLGRAALAGTRKVADASFDARRVGGLGKELGIGEGQKGGFVSAVKAREKKDEEFMKSLADANMEDPKNKAKAMAREDNIKAKASEDEKVANHGLSDLKEMEIKTEQQIVSDLQNLAQQINDKNRVIEDARKNKTLTPKELAEQERQLGVIQQHYGQKNISASRILSKRDAEKSITTLKSKHDATADPKARAQIWQEVEKLEDVKGQLEIELSAQKIALEDKLKSASEITKEGSELASQIAFAEVKFENKIAFMKNVEKSSQRSFTPLEKASLANLQKKFGADARSMSKKDTEAKKSKKLREALADDEITGGGKTSDESKK